MTLMNEVGLDILKMSLCTKNEVSGSKVTAQTGQTDTHTDTQTDMTECITSHIVGGSNSGKTRFDMMYF